MEARAIVRNVRMTPRKIKLICDLIRGKDAGEAMAIIMNTPKAAIGVLFLWRFPQRRSILSRPLTIYSVHSISRA